MDEHRKMAEKIYKEINEIRKFANEADESTESNRVWVETYGDITCDDIIPVIIEHALRSTASKSEKDGWNKAVEECAKLVSSHWNNSETMCNQHDQAYRSADAIRRLIREEK